MSAAFPRSRRLLTRFLPIPSPSNPLPIVPAILAIPAVPVVPAIPAVSAIPVPIVLAVPIVPAIPVCF